MCHMNPLQDKSHEFIARLNLGMDKSSTIWDLWNSRISIEHVGAESKITFDLTF